MSQKNQREENQVNNKCTGYVIYPHNKAVWETLYRKGKGARFLVKAHWGGSAECGRITPVARGFLKRMGYVVEKIPTERTWAVKMISGIKVRIGTDSDAITVVVQSNDLFELTTQLTEIINVIQEKTGVVGEMDILTKMEEC